MILTSALTCLSCHVECGGGPTTTTTILLWNHFQYNCLDCHIVDTLHGGVGHTNCAVCHNGPPQLDNVTASNCIVCHPLTSPGECSLADLSFHQGATCKGCHEHFDCRVTTTTVPATTTTAPNHHHSTDHHHHSTDHYYHGTDYHHHSTATTTTTTPQHRQPLPQHRPLQRQGPTVIMMVSRMTQITVPAHLTPARGIPTPREAMA